MRTLTTRELNRALLARQLLLRRERVPVVRAVERVAGLQAQWAPSLPVGLWTRVEGFRAAQLERALARRALVRGTLMRATIHLVSTRDYLHFLPALDASIRRRYRRAGDETAELEELAAQVTAATREPRPAAEVRALVDPERWFRVLHHARLLRVGECYVAADAWLDRPYQPDGLPLLLRRYLAAWGPATAADAAAWTGLQIGELRNVLEEVGRRRFLDERGRELFDVPRAPLPPADTPAPPRLLPRFDNVVLSHADRTRVISDGLRKTIIRAGEVDPVVLVDGFVAGRWRRKGKRIAVEWLADAPRTARRAIEREAEALEAFLTAPR